MITVRICQNPGCRLEFTVHVRGKRYCTPDCQQEAELARGKGQRRLDKLEREGLDGPGTTPQEKLRWLQLSAGLSQEELGALFGRSHTMIYLWLGGRPMKPAQLQRLEELLAAAEPLHRASERKAALLALTGEQA